ncbi:MULTISPECIES: hypothetical protein [unclassified Methylophaga]|jgi:hypothetical protein|uniref:hypothetical protein n=1 Tax=unclassified Methylophaga TaxID=2629249 RepID=UPI00259C6EC7|nr:MULTISPECIES: hypothetical protein [unclassified Methylophaga]|tara:strand:- start:123 stop:644 length:522 start_codon:yes stop_codon:yes gene_type:complete
MTEVIADWFDTERIIRAAETEDEIGTVLRMHLAIDQLLEFYLSRQITPDLKPYVKMPPNTGQKLAFAAAFGMPIPFVRAMHEVNGIRNKLAHKVKSLTDDIVAQLARQVDSIKEIDESFTPLAKRYIELPIARPGERITFGSGDVRLDFLISTFALMVAASKWFATELDAPNA